MLLLQEIQQHIQQYIQQLPYRPEPVELYAPIQYLMDLGGKRLRPILVILGYQLYKHNYQHILSPAVAVEVFHNFTLMHDDIMDNAPLRRNMPTVHEKWNNNIAILSGDVMLVQAYQLFLACEGGYLQEILQKFNLCASEVCEGQQMDMNFENRNHNDRLVTEQEYIEMIRRKTAVLLGFSLELGGILADAPKEDLVLLKNFGENIGIAFQLKDDLLDVYGDSDKFGKQIGGDIIANKKTYLLIEALQIAPKETLEKLNFWLHKKDFDKNEKVQSVLEIYNQLHIKQLTEQKIQYYYQLAFSQLENLHAKPDNKQNLVDFVTALWYRES